MEALLASMLTGAGGAASSAMPGATAVLSGIPEVYKLLKGFDDKIKAKKIEQALVRPTMSTPASTLDATGMLRLNAMDTRMPAQSAYEQQIARNLAGTAQGVLNMGGGSGERLAALVAANEDAGQQVNNLATMGLNQQVNDIAALAQQLNYQGGIERENWAWNEQDPYIQNAAKAEALRDSGTRNIYGGMKGIGGALMMSSKPPQEVLNGSTGSKMSRINPAAFNFAPSMSKLTGTDFSNFRFQPTMPRDNTPIAPYTQFAPIPPITRSGLF